MMPVLNLPSIPYPINKKHGKNVIFDIIRKKYIQLTPEEWVRQHFVHYLIQYKSYPKALINIENGIQYNKMSKRSDIIGYNREGKPVLLVECKAPQVKINQAAFEQSSAYNSVYKAQYLVVTNGLMHYCCQIDHQKKEYTFLSQLPDFSNV